MLIHGTQYFDELKDALTKAKQASLAVAFWGSGAARLFNEWRGNSLRIICNLASGGTNPNAIRELRKLANIEIRHLSDLHAKLVLTDSRLILGSANVSANGLGLELDEMVGWREAGISTKDVTQRQSASVWFEQQWQEAQLVTDADLDAASAVWQRRRQARPRLNLGQSLIEQPPHVLRDRPIYLAVFRQYASDRARQELEQVKQAIVEEQPESRLLARLEVFEGWDERDLMADPESTLIQVYWGSRGRVLIHDVVRPVPELQSFYIDQDENEKIMLDFMVKQNAVGPWSFNRDDRLRLIEQVRPWLELNGPEIGEGRCYPFYEFRQWELDNHV
ncbi:HKD family nuclease [Fluviicoccus keumensis]|uniref:HKD family nuclease n=1 Tax=Fluviicoccus keumensis TaxID=1435465 RepID=A0A4Q7Z9E3_9GAMM|nr:phospholipase D family protein [Fluviicoccus keumensis]RZU47152.1 HKD family nuclease [Fluviicoccus keumensis]